MPSASRCLLVALLWTLAASAAAAPLEAYGRLPLIEDLQVAPDGSLFAVILTDGENRIVVVREPASETPIAGLRAGDTKLRGLQWVGNRHLVTTVSVTRERVSGIDGGKREYWMASAWDVRENKQMRLLSGQDYSMNIIMGTPMPRVQEGNPLLLLQGLHFVNNTGQNTLFRVDLDTGATRMLKGARSDTVDWVVDEDGDPLAQSLYDQDSGDWTLLARADGEWRTLATERAPIDYPQLLGLGRDGRSVLVGRESTLGELLLSEYDPRAPEGESTPVQVSAGFDEPLFDPVTHALVGGSARVGDALRYSFYDPADQRAWDAISRAFGGAAVELVSWTDDRRRIVVRVDGGAAPPAFSLVNLDTHRAEHLGDVYAGIGEEDVAEVRPVAYAAADGLRITGYLTLPRGRAPERLPLVVLPHGGPAARDNLGFDWWAQALASRGYAVLQPNFRGSDGLGRNFREAGYGEWGRKMQTDLSDGVRDLADKGLVDPARVCIVGASYGGYAALAGVTMQSGIYRCAAAVAGVSDLPKHLLNVRRRYLDSENAALRYYDRFLGTEGLDDPLLDTLSPLAHAAAASAPVLLVHGKDDTVVRYEQSELMHEALKKARKPVELVTLDGEDHWLSRGATRLQMLRAVVDFVEKHNPPG